MFMHSIIAKVPTSVFIVFGTVVTKSIRREKGCMSYYVTIKYICKIIFGLVVSYMTTTL